MIDLHCHSTASDGTREPAELIDEAKRRGLLTIALTDHDTIAGLPAAHQRARAVGIDFVSGIELSVQAPPSTNTRHGLHLLGLFFDPNDPLLVRALADVQRGRERRNEALAERLAVLGMPLRLDEIKATASGGHVTRPHFARAMVARGYVKTEAEAFERWLADDRPASIDRLGLTVKEAVGALHHAGGIAVLAHPLAYARAPESVDRLLRCLHGEGIDGVEVWGPDQTEGETVMLRALAERYGLLMSGGSDFHVPPWPDMPSIPNKVLRPLVERAESYRRSREGPS